MNPQFDPRRLVLAAFMLCGLVLLQFTAPMSAHAASQATRASVLPPWGIWTSPVTPPQQLVRGFVAPQSRYGAGHRGIDLATTDGAVLLAPAAGTVAFAGLVATKPVLVLAHSDGLSSTFEPACTQLAVGASVSQGALVGSVCGTGYASHCTPLLCLHFAARKNGENLSPQFLLGQMAPSRLIA